MRFIIDRENFRKLPKLADFLRRKKAQNLEVEIVKSPGKMPKFSAIAGSIYETLDYERFFGVWLINFPFCVFSPEGHEHIVWRREKFKKGKTEKTEKCRKCKMNALCGGFPVGYLLKFGKNEIKPIPDLPSEISVEVESGCNFNCVFCFNKISFAKNGRMAGNLKTAEVKKIIDGVSRAGISMIRFTGGEPLIRKDIFEIFKYAKNKNLLVCLNTNGSLITGSLARKMKGLVDNVLIPIESARDADESGITNHPGALRKKIQALGFLKKAKIPVIRAGTVATKKSIREFGKISRLVLKLPVDRWEWYRPNSNGEKKNPISGGDLEILVGKIIELKNRTGKEVSITNSVPFCAVENMNKINSVSLGGWADLGQNRLAADPRGFFKPHYFDDKELGGFPDALKAWNSPFMKKMRNMVFLPEQCTDCNFKFKCRGGSRYEAKIFSGSYGGIDPLMEENN